MPRAARVAPPGMVYHVLNRAAGRMHMFRKDADFEILDRIRITYLELAGADKKLRVVTRSFERFTDERNR